MTMEERQRILGVDPAFNRSGWAVLSRTESGVCLAAHGAIIARGKARAERIHAIFKEFDDVVRLWQPEAVYLERPGVWQRRGGTRRETLEVLAMSRGVMLLACANREVPAHDIDINTIRRTVVGRVNASATVILEFVRQAGFKVPLRPRGEPDLDVANAIVVGLFGLSWRGSSLK
jgi:Holliday junction resolvasome RuvABC endonuclease subunit